MVNRGRSHESRAFYWYAHEPLEEECVYQESVTITSMSRNIYLSRDSKLLRWLETVSSTFQDLEFDGSL